MVRLVYGERIGATARLRVGCNAVVFDASHTRVLLTQRADNGLWCMPGGAMDPGESAAEAVLRETREETGLETRVVRLVGIYTSPDLVLEYADGNRWQAVALTFELAIVSGEPVVTDETRAVGFFTPAEIEALDMLENHIQRIRDALTGQPEAYIR
jgi:8-oxo-dGTP pyrophosphatase MutT (NUDIX family)